MFLSLDGAWRIREVVVDGVHKYRIDRTGYRHGYRRWFWVADVRTPGEVWRSVYPLGPADFREVKDESEPGWLPERNT